VIVVTDPEGTLTPAQFEIMQLLWSESTSTHGAAMTDSKVSGVNPLGMSVVEIWEATGKPRHVSRTTTLNLVDRLEKRGWLRREKVDGVFRYSAAVERQTTEARIANDFVGDFFGGSPSQLLLSLLGSRKISKGEIERLRALLAAPTPKANSSTPNPKSTRQRPSE
jgi:predicted transcriptional regulator